MDVIKESAKDLKRQTKDQLIMLVQHGLKLIEHLTTELRDTEKAAENTYAILSKDVKDAKGKLQVAMVIIEGLTKERDLASNLFNNAMSLYNQQYRASRDLRDHKVHRAIERFTGFPIAICYNCGHIQRADPSSKEGGQNLCDKCLEVANG